MEDARWPTYDEVVGILYELATKLFGSADNPYPAFDVMDRGLIESAIHLPRQGFYESFEDKLAAMVRSIAANHGLRDGNKRLALTVLHTTLLVNDYLYVWNDEAAEQLMYRCARGDTDFRWLSRFIRMWSRPAAEVGMSGVARAPLDDPEGLGTIIEQVRHTLAAGHAATARLNELRPPRAR